MEGSAQVPTELTFEVCDIF